MAHTHYAEFEMSTGRILRRGICDLAHVPDSQLGNAIALVIADPRTDMIVHEGLDGKGTPIKPKVTASTLPVRVRPKVAEGKRSAIITKDELAALMTRLAALEAR